MKKYSEKFTAMQLPRVQTFKPLADMTTAEKRREYSRLRSIERKRVERAKAAGGDVAASRYVTYYENQFRPLEDIDRYNITLDRVLADLRRAINTGAGGVQYARARLKADEELANAMPATKIMEPNVRGEFFEYLHEVGLIHQYDSGEVMRAADMYEATHDDAPSSDRIKEIVDDYVKSRQMGEELKKRIMSEPGAEEFARKYGMKI